MEKVVHLIKPALEDVYISAVEQLIDVITAEDPRLVELKKDSYNALRFGTDISRQQSYERILEHKVTLIKSFTQRLATVKGIKQGESLQHGGNGIQENGSSENNVPTIGASIDSGNRGKEV